MSLILILLHFKRFKLEFLLPYMIINRIWSVGNKQFCGHIQIMFMFLIQKSLRFRLFRDKTSLSHILFNQQLKLFIFSYSWNLLFIHFCQTRSTPILPIIQEEVSEVTINVSLRGLPMLLKTMPEVIFVFNFSSF